MVFKTRGQQACYEKIVPMMKEIFGEFAHTDNTDPVILIPHGTTLTQTIVLPWGSDDAMICTLAWVTKGTELTSDLLLYLLKLNLEVSFGAFAIDDNDNIVFIHTIVGSTCDKEELKASVMSVLFNADRYDEEIVQRWGGLRFSDTIDD